MKLFQDSVGYLIMRIEIFLVAEKKIILKLEDTDNRSDSCYQY